MSFSKFLGKELNEYTLIPEHSMVVWKAGSHHINIMYCCNHAEEEGKAGMKTMKEN